MFMKAGEIARDYRLSAHPWEQITVLADLNGCSRHDIIEVLRSQGINPFGEKSAIPRLALNADEADMLFELLKLSLNRLKERKRQFSPEKYESARHSMESIIRKLVRIK